MKKLLAMLLVGTMVFSVTACGSAGKPSEEASVSTEDKTQEDMASSPEVDEEPEKIVPLKVYFLGNPVADSDFAPVLEAINEVTREEINAELDITFIDGGSMQEKMNVIMASQEVFDVCWTGYCNSYPKAVMNGSLYDLTDLISNSKAVQAAVPEGVMAYTYIDGSTYAVPCMQTMTAVEAITLRKDLVDKYNFDWEACRTLEDFAPFFELIKENEPDIIPFDTDDSDRLWKSYTDKYEFLGGSATCGLVLRKDGSNELVSVYDIPEYREGAELMHEFYKKGYIREDILTYERGNKPADKKAGKYAAWAGGSKPGIEAENFNTYGYETYVKTITEPTLNTPVNTMLSVSATSENPEKAFELIELLCSNSDLMNLITYGVEGTDYSLNEAGKIVLSSDSNYDQSGFSWAFGNQFLLTLTENQPDGLWEETIEVNNTAKLPYKFNFSIPSEVSQAYATESSLYLAIYNEYNYIIKNGVKDPDEYWDELQERLSEIQGVAKKYLQPVVDEWIKNNK